MGNGSLLRSLAIGRRLRPEKGVRQMATDKHDKCPECGFEFSKPQARCFNRAACERRKAGKPGRAPSAKAADKKARTEATKQGITERAARKRGEGVAPGAEKAQDIKRDLNGDEVQPIRVKLTSQGQEVYADQLFPGGDGNLETVRQGHWLVIPFEERDAVVTRITDAVSTTAEEPPRQLTTLREKVFESLGLVAA